MKLEKQLEAAVRACAADPVLFTEEVLGDSLWPVQAEILESVRDNPRTVVPSCHASGKTHVSARAGLWGLVFFPGSLVLTLAPTHRQVRDALWREIRMAYRKSRWPLGGNLLPVEPRLTLADDWYMFGFATDRPANLQGLHAKRLFIIVDEAPGVEADMWEPLESLMAGGDSRLLAIGNPLEPTGMFFEMCRDPHYHRINISAFGTPNLTAFGITPQDIEDGGWRDKVTGPLPYPGLITPEWVAERHHKWGPASPMYLSRVLGEFPQSATDALISLAWIDAARRRQFEETPSQPARPIILAIDPARFGSSESVMVLRRGRTARVEFAVRGWDTVQLAGKAAEIARREGADLVVVDEIGLGAGVVDQLRRTNLRVLGLNSSAAPSDKEYFVNARAEWYWELRERFHDGEIAMDEHDEEAAAQLSSLKYDYRSGRLLVESKEDMAKRGLESPDRADGYMLAFAHDSPSGKLIIPGGRRRPPRKFDDWPDERDEHKRGWW